MAGALPFCALASGADGATLWQLDGESNRVYLLGSIHVLSEGDYPLSPVLLDAYDDAEALMMEIDLDDLDPLAASTLLISRARPDEGESLRTIIGEEAWEAARSAAAATGFRLEDFSGSEPWYAAMVLTQTAMAREGYQASLGVDLYLSELAQGDGKPIEGLETFEQQIEFFDSLPNGVQADLLLQTLADIAEYAGDVSDMVGAWKRGDIGFLETELLAALKAFPQLYRVLVIERNRDWVGKIEPLLGESDDYLVVVGALHLVGPDSVNRLLENKGYRLKQLGIQ